MHTKNEVISRHEATRITIFIFLLSTEKIYHKNNMSNVVELLKSKVKTSKDELEKALIKVKHFLLFFSK